MELVGYRFFFLILSFVLTFLSLLVPFTNIETEISYYGYDAAALDAAYQEQLLRVNAIGIIGIVCHVLEIGELLLAVSLLLRYV